MLIVEDGSVVANANSYNTIAEIQSYATVRGITLSGNCEALAIKAMDYLEAQRDKYQGYKTDDTQILQFPRTNVYIDNVLLDSNTIPKELKNAQCQLVVEQNEDVVLQPTQTEAFITEEIIGPIETKYSESGAGNIKPTMTAVNSLLKVLYAPIYGSNGMAVHT